MNEKVSHSGRLDDSSGNGAVFFQKSAILNLSKMQRDTFKKINIKKEVFDMNTKTMEQFEVMDVEMLASVEGGYSAGKCLADIGWGMVEGVVTGAIAGGLMGAGIGFGLGQIGGSIYCIGNVLGGK
ncbi:bacteriocin class II family protein [Streptococcus suis]